MQALILHKTYCNWIRTEYQGLGLPETGSFLLLP